MTRAKTQTRAMARLMEQRDAVIAQVQRIAKDGSTEMMQLAQRLRMASLMSADPFAKIKGMIQEMIEKLVEEAGKEAEHKAYCDKEMGETKVKKEDMEGYDPKKTHMLTSGQSHKMGSSRQG